MKAFRKAAVAVLLVCLLPFVAVLLASLAGYLAGCEFDLGMARACTVAGRDIDPALQLLGSFGYGTFFTVPLAILTLVAWGLAEAVHRLRRTATGHRRTAFRQAARLRTTHTMTSTTTHAPTTPAAMGNVAIRK